MSKTPKPAMQHSPASTVIALDVGAVRIGVAIASLHARVAQPLKTITNDEHTIDNLLQLFDEHDTAMVVIGLPRGLNGQYTAQTRAVETFAAELERHLGLPLHWQDEAVTSAQAEAELIARKKPYNKGDIDALAATYILEDFLREHLSGRQEIIL